MFTVEQLAKFMEEDGHGGCADDFRKEPTPEVAYLIAECYEHDDYMDPFAVPMPAILREWADSQEKHEKPDCRACHHPEIDHVTDTPSEVSVWRPCFLCPCMQYEQWE